MTFTLSESLAQEEGQRLGLEIPRQHRLLTQDISSQSLATFSEDSSSGEFLSGFFFWGGGGGGVGAEVGSGGGGGGGGAEVGPVSQE